MEENAQRPTLNVQLPSKTAHKIAGLRAPRFWIATAFVIIVVIAVWKFIDIRMQPPPPPPDTQQIGR